MKFAKCVYTIAGIYGLIVMLPLYFMRPSFATSIPLEIYYLGFVGLGLAWQVAFLIIGSDPIRYRPLMIASWVEKLSFAIPAFILHAQHELDARVFAASLMDCVLAVLFVAAWFTTAKAVENGTAKI